MNTITRLVFLLAVAAPLGASRVEAARIYVNAQAKSPTPDGTSWKTAYVKLQDALDKAASSVGSDEIWIARGTYVPTKIYAPGGVIGGASGLNTASLKTFDLPDHVTLYGGFDAKEKTLAQRRPDAGDTILSGGGVSWHVVTAGNDVAKTGVTAALDGLTIRDGHAQGAAGGDLLFAPFAYDHSLGAGLYVAFDSAIDVNNVYFLNNVAAGDGGGLFSINSTLRVTRSYFSRNTAVTRAGAIEVLNTYETIAHQSSIATSLFADNAVSIFGGAIVGEGTLPHDDSSMHISGCVFIDNTALEGGAIVFDSLNATVSNSLFRHNVATVTAGALATTNVVDTIVNGAIFGPAHVFKKFVTTVSNSVFEDNIAQGDQAAHDALFGGPAAGLDFAIGGGALVAYMNGYLTVTSSLFHHNIARRGDGGAILNGRAAAQNVFGTGADAFDVKTTVRSSVFADNQAPLGNGGAIATLPDQLLNLPALTVANTTLTVTGSAFHGNETAGNGGAIYLTDSTATLDDNLYRGNHANLGDSVYGLDSVINGSSASPFVVE